MAQQDLTVDDVLEEVADLIAVRLHRVPASSPGFTMLGTIVTQLRDDLTARATPTPDTTHDDIRGSQAVALAAWTDLDREVRAGSIRVAIGDETLRTSEIVGRVRTAFPQTRVENYSVASVLNQMQAAGELDRERLPRRPGTDVSKRGSYRLCWRRRRLDMSPELRDLERRLKEA